MFEVLDGSKGRFVYKRELNGESFIIDCNLSKDVKKAYRVGEGYQLIFPAITNKADSDKLGAYEVRSWCRM